MENEKQIAELTKKIDKVLFYLESDPTTKQEGLVEKVNRIDKDVEEIKSREKVYLAKAGMVGGIAWVGCQIAWVFIARWLNLK